jgi:hypothetical protein
MWLFILGSPRPIGSDFGCWAGDPPGNETAIFPVRILVPHKRGSPLLKKHYLRKHWQAAWILDPSVSPEFSRGMVLDLR